MIDAAAPRFDDNGVFLGYIGSVIDITKRKNVEEALRESEAALKEADRRKDEFLRSWRTSCEIRWRRSAPGWNSCDWPATTRRWSKRCEMTMERQSQQMVRLDRRPVGREPHYSRHDGAAQVARGAGVRGRKCGRNGPADHSGNGASA